MSLQPFVGKPVEEAELAYGKPDNILTMSDGRQAYQFRLGGTLGPGCVATFITKGDVIEEYRMPPQLFC